MGKKLLVVDDALFMRHYIKGVLKEAGFEECIEAVNALDGVKKYKEFKPDLVTMDIIMPRVEELDGIGAIKQILEFNPQAKVIIISAVAEDPLVKEAIERGARGFLVKPFKPDKLLELVNNL